MSNNLEKMNQFFDVRADSYDEHMNKSIGSFETYYVKVADPIKNTDETIEILDLGCGTGLELRSIFEKAPNARITCIDMSEKMLELLKSKYSDKLNQINIIQGSYTELDLGQQKYDYVISVMTMHHLLHNDKEQLYKKIKEAIKPNGTYIEGDYVVTKEKEENLVNFLEEVAQKHGLPKDGSYHIDIPFSLETQRKLFSKAGFAKFEVVFKEGEHTIIVSK
ncbi:methyltransferase domain-containing protein [Proteinivorax tanatarense]|uniref:Methyltransferase domain-containing protein n=1 Tax=Proteinivorax tanatarense TaxID=1260629 RepID=A0AAU7VJA6_9FIRM